MITSNKIQKLKDKEEELNKIKKELTEKVKAAKKNKKTKHIIEREGREIEIEEQDLWEEFYRLEDLESQAGKILSEKYPEVFKNYKKHQKKLKELKDMYEEKIGDIGIDAPRFVKLVDGINWTLGQIDGETLIEITNAVIDYKNE